MEDLGCTEGTVARRAAKPEIDCGKWFIIVFYNNYKLQLL